jgi:hypothetical protein
MWYKVHETKSQIDIFFQISEAALLNLVTAFGLVKENVTPSNSANGYADLHVSDELHNPLETVTFRYIYIYIYILHKM